MRASTSCVEMYRVKKFSSEKDEFNGLFFIPGAVMPKTYGDTSFLKVVASSGFSWDHVSVMHPDRVPTNADMEIVRSLFWDPDETVIEYHDVSYAIDGLCKAVAERHLWRPQGCEVIRPPSRISSQFCISVEEDGVEGYTEVESSNIAAVKYDASEKLLYVVFTSGAHYAYEGVPGGVYEGLLDAESVGRYFHAQIRNNFQAKKIEEDE